MKSSTANSTNECIDKIKAHKWDKRFIELCDHLAMWSEDPSRKVGAVVVGKENCILSTGYNGLPRGVMADTNKHFDRTDGRKYYWIEHAERNAIFNAARNGISTEKSTIYCSLFPCSDCARAIIQSGIRELVTRELPEDEVRFADSMAISLEMLIESGVSVRFIPTQ
jgi:dCMP deaminase